MIINYFIIIQSYSISIIKGNMNPETTTNDELNTNSDFYASTKMLTEKNIFAKIYIGIPGGEASYIHKKTHVIYNKKGKKIKP